VSSNPKLEVNGPAPFKQAGVYEVQIFITDKKPGDESVAKRSFNVLWKDSFHLRVRNGTFTQVLGSAENPLPDSVLKSPSVWVVVVDQFLSLHSSFELQLSVPPPPSAPASPPKAKKAKAPPEPPESRHASAGPRGDKRPAGPSSPRGPADARRDSEGSGCATSFCASGGVACADGGGGTARFGTNAERSAKT